MHSFCQITLNQHISLVLKSLSREWFNFIIHHAFRSRGQSLKCLNDIKLTLLHFSVVVLYIYTCICAFSVHFVLQT